MNQPRLLWKFANKSLSLSRMGNRWFARLVSGLFEAGRTHSYVETVNSVQADSLHKDLKMVGARWLQRAFEQCVRSTLSKLGLGRVMVALDVTEDPYWGRNGGVNTRSRVHEKSDESWQWLNLSIVQPHFVPLMSVPYRQVDSLDSLVIDLLEYLRTLSLKVELVLFDRGFYHARLIDYLTSCRRGRPWPYLMLVPRNQAIKKYLDETDKVGVFKHQLNYSYKKSQWRPTTTIVICKKVCGVDWVFATNQRPGTGLVFKYKKRWNIETGFRIHDEAQIKSKSNNPIIRFFYHLVGMVMVLAWRANNTRTYLVFKRYLKHAQHLLFEELPTQPP